MRGCVGGEGQREAGRLLRAPAYAGMGVMCDSTGKEKKGNNKLTVCVSVILDEQ